MAPAAKMQQNPNITIRPTPEDRKIISLLHKKLGVDTSQIFRLAIRKLAASEGIAILVLALASLCWGQEFRATKADHVLLATDGAAKAADFWFTTRNLQFQTVCKTNTSVGSYCYSGRGTEANPIARPFVTHGTAAAAGYFAGTFILDAVVSRQLRKHGHPKIARAVLLFGILNSAHGATTSALGSVQ